MLGRAERRDVGAAEGEMDELHAGGLALGGGAVLILFRLSQNGLAADLDEGGFLDAAEAGEHAGAAERDRRSRS